MTNINNIIFIDNLPKLDLHGLTKDIANVYINDFINDNLKLKNEFIVIVHGIGSGALRLQTKETLSKNKNVLEFKTYYYNQGCTIVKLKIWQPYFFMLEYLTKKAEIRFFQIWLNIIFMLVYYLERERLYIDIGYYLC